MINIVVEGESDSEAAQAVVRAAGHEVGLLRVARGKARLDEQIAKYNAASRHAAWVMFRDTDSVCPVSVATSLLASVHNRSQLFQLRLAHSMTEAWLLADRERFAAYFGLSAAALPRNPEALPHAKREVLRLVRSSRHRIVREDVVTEDGDIGPLYVSRINTFARDAWRPLEAAENSLSLRKAVRRLSALPL